MVPSESTPSQTSKRKDHATTSTTKINSKPSKMDSSEFNWLQCSRYEPPKVPRNKRREDSGRKTGPRIPFSTAQLLTLEKKFQHSRYLNSNEVQQLCTALDLTEARVKIWFQNRRARERREKQQMILQSRTEPIQLPSSNSAFRLVKAKIKY